MADNQQLDPIQDYKKNKDWVFGAPITPDDLNNIEDHINVLTQHTQEVEENIKNIFEVSTTTPQITQPGHYFNQIWINPSQIQSHTIPTIEMLQGYDSFIAPTSSKGRYYIYCNASNNTNNPGGFDRRQSSTNSYQYWIISCKQGDIYEINGAGSTYSSGSQKNLPRYCLCYVSPNDIERENEQIIRLNNVTNIKYASSTLADNARVPNPPEIITIESGYNFLIVHDQDALGYVKKKNKGLIQSIDNLQEKLTANELSLATNNNKNIIDNDTSWQSGTRLDSTDTTHQYITLTVNPDTRYYINIMNYGAYADIQIQGKKNNNYTKIRVIPTQDQKINGYVTESFYTEDYFQIVISKHKDTKIIIPKIDEQQERILRSLYTRTYDLFEVGRLRFRSESYGTHINVSDRTASQFADYINNDETTFIQTAIKTTYDTSGNVEFANAAAELIRAENLKIALVIFDEKSDCIGIWDGQKINKQNHIVPANNYDVNVISKLVWFDEINLAYINSLYSNIYPNLCYKIIAYKPGFIHNINLERDSKLIHFYTKNMFYSSIGLYRKWAYIGASSDSGYYKNLSYMKNVEGTLTRVDGKTNEHYEYSWPNILSRIVGNQVLNYSKHGRYILEFLKDKTSSGKNTTSDVGMTTLLKELKDSFLPNSKKTEYKPCELYVIGLGGNDSTGNHNSFDNGVYPLGESEIEHKAYVYPSSNSDYNINYAWQAKYYSNDYITDIEQLFQINPQTNKYELKSEWIGYTFENICNGEAEETHTLSLTEYPNNIFGQYWATVVTLQSYINYFCDQLPNANQDNFSLGLSVRPKIVLAKIANFDHSEKHNRINHFIDFIGQYYGIPVIDWFNDDFMRSTIHLKTREESHPIKPVLGGKALAFDRLFSDLVANNYEYFTDRYRVDVGFDINSENDPYGMLSYVPEENEEINNYYFTKTYTIDDITKLEYTTNKQLVAPDGTTETQDTGKTRNSQYYILFGEKPLHLKTGSTIKLIDNKNYAMQIAYYNSDGSYISTSYKGNGSEPQNIEPRKINITEDCYIRFTIKKRDNTQINNNTNINDYLDQLIINLIIIDDNIEQLHQLVNNLPPTAGTYTLTATVDANGIATYSWVSQT